MKEVDLVGLHVEATTGTPLVLLREQELPHRVLPIFIGSNEAAAIALALAGEVPPRPLTHDLMATLVEVLEAHVERVEVTELEDGAFLAELAVTGPGGDRRIATRPSDGIALALRVHAPLYASDDLLAAVGAVLETDGDDDAEAPDPAVIDEQVRAFRSALESMQPTDFGSRGQEPGAEGPEPPTAD